MHAPQPAPRSTSPLRGHYGTVILDNGLFRTYYRETLNGYRGPFGNGNPGEITCYAESDDGDSWHAPDLGIYTVSGPDGNNIILAGSAPYSHNFGPFLDRKPGVASHERFKAIAGIKSNQSDGLGAFISGNGLVWEKINNGPVITSSEHAFDSQNVAFWSLTEQCYVCYCRTWNTSHGEL